jgi:hypothetical protein
MEHDALWSTWPVNAENILIPDEADIARGYGRYYGMPVAYYAGMYWGFLWLYGASEDIYTEITFSRDGRRFHRLAARSPLLDRGPEGAWDHGMIFVSRWVEVGDEWRLYYSGADADHRSWSATTGIGLALMRKEGFASLRSPAGGGVVVTRLLQWPGGGLHVNADARSGELRIGVTGYDRTPFPGLAASDCLPLSGDGVRQQATWRGSDIRALAGQRVRLEFHMAGGVDLYGFRAAPDGAAPQ